MPVVQRIDAGPTRRQRNLEERVLAAAPGLYRLIARLFGGLRPANPLRRWLLRRQAISGWAAASREDWDLMVVRYSPDVVYGWNRELRTLGLPERVEGRDAWLRSIRDFLRAWESWDYKLAQLVDIGERLVLLGSVRLRGASSGAELEIPYAQVLDFDRGVVAQELDFTTWAEALAEAGLDPGLVGAEQ